MEPHDNNEDLTSPDGAVPAWENELPADEPRNARPYKKGGRPEVYDWASIKLEVRAGQLTIAEIARQRNIAPSTIRKKITRAREAGDNSWEPDLQAVIVRQSKERLAKVGGVATDSEELDLVEIAVQTRIRVVERHQKDLRKLRTVGEKLLTRLEEYLKDGTAKGPFKGEKESPADVLRKVSDAFRFAIPLERQAFGISDDAGSESERPDQGGIVYMPQKAPLIVDGEGPQPIPDEDPNALDDVDGLSIKPDDVDDGAFPTRDRHPLLNENIVDTIGRRRRDEDFGDLGDDDD